jgi:hypothetical protein
VSQWQNQQYDPRHRQPAVPPQWQQDAPPRDYRPPQYPPQPRYEQTVPARPYQPPRSPQRAAAAARRKPLPRYPRFPRFSGRSRRSPSIFRMVYLGTHPIALIMSLAISCLLIEVWVMVAMVVVSFWALQCGVVAIRRAAARRG